MDDSSSCVSSSACRKSGGPLCGEAVSGPVEPGYSGPGIPAVSGALVLVVVRSFRNSEFSVLFTASGNFFF